MYPRFAEPIPNVTVTVGRDALLACVVDNLRGFKVNIKIYYINKYEMYKTEKRVYFIIKGDALLY